MALINNTKPATAAVSNAPAAPEKNRAVAFVNWGIRNAEGQLIKSSKGFPIFQNPQYPNKQEDLLVELAKRHNGKVRLTLEAQVMLNTPSIDPEEIDLDSIILAQ